jgi:hypothetical protein
MEVSILIRSLFKVRKILLLTLLIALPIAVSSCRSGSGASNASGGDDVAALVNGTKILVKDVDRAITQQFRGQENQLTPLQRAAAQLQAIESLINQEVLFQRAQKSNIAPE